MAPRNIYLKSRISLPTKLVLLLGGGAFLFANLRESGWLKLFGLRAEDDWNPFAQYLFTRGWPLSPYMICERYPGMSGRWHPEDGFVWLTLLADALLAVVTLISGAFVSEWLVKRWRERTQPPAFKSQGRLHVHTKLVIVLSASAFLWANAFQSPTGHRKNLGPPEDFGLIAQSLFIRGWPISPRMFTLQNNDKWHPEADYFLVWGTLAVDAFLAFDALVAIAVVSEWTIRKSRFRPRVPS